MEMMDLARAVEQDVLFVSDDMKADWRQIVDDKDFGPLPDLLREFADETGQRYHHVNSDTFLEDLNTYLDADVDDDVIDEVKTHAFLSPILVRGSSLPEETKERLREWVRTNEAFSTRLNSEAFHTLLSAGKPASMNFENTMFGPGNPASAALAEFLRSAVSQTPSFSDSGERSGVVKDEDDRDDGQDDEDKPAAPA